VVAAAQRCGITSPLVANASLALGTSEVTPLEITTAYAAFANGGNRVYPYFVTEVDDSSGRILYRRQAPQPQRIIASHVNRDLVAMLYGVVTSGTGRAAALDSHEAAGKTGTTQDYRDAWFVGFTTDYVSAVWVGNDDNTAMRGVTGGTLPAIIWHDTMTAAERGLAATPLDRSPPQPPVDTNLFDNGESAVPAAGDDESSRSIDATGGAPAAPSGEQPQSKPHHGFLGWLFGNDEDDTVPPPRGSDTN
jgi:penicillin-binding protein 1A